MLIFCTSSRHESVKMHFYFSFKSKLYFYRTCIIKTVSSNLKTQTQFFIFHDYLDLNKIYFDQYRNFQFLEKYSNLDVICWINLNDFGLNEFESLDSRANDPLQSTKQDPDGEIENSGKKSFLFFTFFHGCVLAKFQQLPLVDS